MIVTFSKPATYSGVKRIDAMADVHNYGWASTVLHLEKSQNGWDVIRPSKNAIYANTTNSQVAPGQSAKWFAQNLPLREAKELATQIIQQDIWHL